jgi:predicted kinase
VFSVDPIEAAMLDAGIRRGHESGVAAYLVAAALADARLRLGQGAIVDAVNGVRWDKQLWRRIARRHGAELRVIVCVCSSSEVHRRRLAARRRGLPTTFREPTWRDVLAREREWTVWTEPTLVVDAVEPRRRNAARALAWLRSHVPPIRRGRQPRQ